MATLNIYNHFTYVGQGRTIEGKHGESDDAVTDGQAITVTGPVEEKIGTLATATACKIWDEDEDAPSDIDYLYFWADKDCYIQIIGQTTNVVFPVEAFVPFVLSGNTLLAAANTTALSGAAPSVEAIDSVVIQNNSGNEMNYHLAVFD